MSTKVTIDPITRLEGHGKIDIFLNNEGSVDHAYLQIPELRGFEQFAVGRPAEDMPQITSRICGVCPTAHHMASTKALDDLYKVEPTRTARLIRELFYMTFFVEDHALHFYYLGGPDFVVGPTAPKAERNILGVLGKVGMEVGLKVITTRKHLREMMTEMGGKVIHPVLGKPGGVAKRMTKEVQEKYAKVARDAVDFGLFSLQVFRDIVLKNSAYVDAIVSDTYTHKTYYMGMVDKNNQMNFYEGDIRVVDPSGKEYCKFPTGKYLDYVAEHVEPWSYMKFCYLKPLGWKGFVDGPDSGIYSVAPLARVNVTEGMPTPHAQEAYAEFFKTLGGRPVHHTLANHWARLIELLYAAERMVELTADPEIIGENILNIPTNTPKEGIGIVEAPRGTLFHHYQSDERGVLTAANLIVATAGNAARTAMSVDKAAKGLIKNGKCDDGVMNMIEMAFRAYDPCHGCATHTLPGSMPLILRMIDPNGNLIEEIRRDT
ncbi:MAG: Ni/Fe hydrogenase subunit alpha [bacterium]|nr:Ni/Fe hydrogenase subunit alpha [bacterium]